MDNFLLDGEMYQYNLGWLIKRLKSMETDLNTAIDLKTIHYADPIQWDITTQYSPNTVVIDPKTGTAYMSKVPVPAGIQLTNESYWVVVFNYQQIYEQIKDGVASNERLSKYASKDYAVNDLVWWGNDLYRVLKPITSGGQFKPDDNIVKTKIENYLPSYDGTTGTLSISGKLTTGGNTDVSKINFNGSDIDVTDAYAREQLRHLTADNYIADVNGDYTVNAGDITMTSKNATHHTTADRTIDTDGNDSVHIDGASTLNVGGLRTETFAGDKAVTVTGTATERAGNRNTTVTGKWLVSIPDKSFDMKDVALQRDVTAAIDAAIANVERERGGVVTIGDSYGRGEGSGTVGKYTSWCEQLRSILNKTAGVDYWTASAGGVGFHTSHDNKTFITLLNNLAASMSADQKNDVGKILVAGGYNDRTIEGTSEITAFIKRARELYPHATVYIASIGWTPDYNVAKDIANNVTPVYITGANMNNAVYIANSQYSLHNYTWFDADGIHPNNDGQRHIAEMLAQGLRTGACDNVYPLEEVNLSPAGFTKTVTKNAYIRVENECTYLLFNETPLNFTSTTPINANTTYELAKLNSKYIRSLDVNSIPCMGYARKADGTYFNFNETLWMAGDVLKIAIHTIKTDGTAFVDPTTLGEGWISVASVTLPTSYC